MAGPAAAQPARVGRIDVTLNAGLTRIILEGDQPLQAGVSAASTGLGLKISMKNAVFSGRDAGGQLAGGLIAALTLPQAGEGEVSLELLDPAIIDRAFQLPPQAGRGHRLVLDLLPADPANFTASFAAAVTVPLPPEPPAPAPPGGRRDPRKLVLLDPGHGGHDPGATSASGRYEKDLTLAMARAIARKLEATRRYRVVLTRDRDVTVRLPDRVALARRHEADLFLSIHADSLSADRATRGASVYTRAKDASDREAEALALRENRADQLAETAVEAEVDDVVAILFDLASRDTQRLSSRFAGLLAASLAEGMPLRRNGLRAANFRVLSAPDIPSALLELGYISNPSEEALLFSDAGREKLAGAVAEAIDRFFAVATPP